MGFIIFDIQIIIQHIMKKIILTLTALATFVASHAHPGHDHSNMDANTFNFHLLWILAPVVIGVAVVLVSKKKKSAQKNIS